MKKLLVIGFVWPEPKSSAAGSRMLQLISQFQKQGYEITFATATNDSDNAFDLSSINVEIVRIKINDSSFNSFVKQLNPSVVLFDRFMTEEQFGWRVAEECPNALRILDTEDFHGLRKGRAAALKNEANFSIDYLQNDTTIREVASMYRCDLSLMISEVEIQILTKQLKVDSNLLYYLPFLQHPVSETIKQSVLKFREREHFITIGNFLHAPNYDAVLYLKKEIWPLIKKKIPNVELHIYGAYVSQKVKQLHNPESGFLIQGFADDVNRVVQNSKALLAPLRFGAGLKGKIIDAMQNGTPCVMSSIAAEGMFDSSTPLTNKKDIVQPMNEVEVNGFIENNPEAFAKRAVELFQKESLWNKKQEVGFKVITQRFDMSLFSKQFQEKIDALSKNLAVHRQENFFGQILMHHSLQSTKYMSKWIEAKNS